jgi:hypothetical protein
MTRKYNYEYLEPGQLILWVVSMTTVRVLTIEEFSRLQERAREFSLIKSSTPTVEPLSWLFNFLKPTGYMMHQQV